ncbi:MAG: hypothetical protein B6U72_04370 [Candidatus Altiarchaeales archaeon ex4484_2]|nr:MAG: hypothetical protein B6U72_04370 [Candidatus Altiarchaeales archaeon ex4484_2]
MDKEADDGDAAEDCEGFMNELRVQVTIPSDIAEICRRAISLESSHAGLRKTEVMFSCSGDGLELRVLAGDYSSLRAALNTYLRLITMCVTIIPLNK